MRSISGNTEGITTGAIMSGVRLAGGGATASSGGGGPGFFTSTSAMNSTFSTRDEPATVVASADAEIAPRMSA